MAKFAVIGLGRFGSTVAKTLFENGNEVIAIDKDPGIVEEMNKFSTQPVILDSTNESALKTVGLEYMDAVILGIGSHIEESILTAAILKKLGVNNIYAKVDNELHGRILKLIGVKQIYLPEQMIGIQLARSLSTKNIFEFVNLSSGHVLVEMIAPVDFIGKTLQEIALPTTYGIHVVAIKYNELKVTDTGENIIDQKTNDIPGANDIIHEDDILIILGARNSVNELLKKYSK
ncbi:MAG: TrkA family potassium uptake protein [Candidatus Zophobacter franzmannii]|nr:TrkA family potassium uptake protein [Candidatus Zophobacter franzmannii]